MPDIDVIVPTVPGREESLDRCVSSFPDCRVIVVRDQPSCGAAWIEGIKRSSGDYLMLSADDIEARSSNWIEPCIETVDAGYLPAPVVDRPNGSLESAGGDLNASGCLINEIQADWTPVDFTPMPFLSREQVKKIKMIPSHMMCDVWVSYRGRQLGIETVLRTNYSLVHHHEEIGRLHGTDPADREIFDRALLDVG